MKIQWQQGCEGSWAKGTLGGEIGDLAETRHAELAEGLIQRLLEELQLVESWSIRVTR